MAIVSETPKPAIIEFCYNSTTVVLVKEDVFCFCQHGMESVPRHNNFLVFQTGVAPGSSSSSVKNLSPLDAAINETSTRSSPAVARRPVDSELYISDDEF